MGERGGVLLRVGRDGGAALGFIPAEVARRLTAVASLTPVPGARPPALGIALADGAVVTVLRVGQAGPERRPAYAPGDDWLVPGADCAVLCQVGGFDVALTGAVVVATGVFDEAAGHEGVLWRGEVVPVLDVRALYAQAEAATWAARAVHASAAPRAPEEALAEGEDEGARRTLLPGASGPIEERRGEP